MRILGSVLLLGSVLAVACADVGVDDVDPISWSSRAARAWDDRSSAHPRSWSSQNASVYAPRATTAARRFSTGDHIQSIVNAVGCESETVAHMPEAILPPAYLDLGTMLRPFAAKLHTPHVVKFAGAGGVPLEEHLQPKSVAGVMAMIMQENEPRSVVLHLEELDSVPSPWSEMLRPFLPLTNLTAHVYISNQGASALKNHTDVTEVLVLQVHGRKEWLYCREREREEVVLPWLPAAVKSALSTKTSKCATYAEDEMDLESLDCSRVITSPGDALHLPRRTIHSARAVAGEISVHLTLGIQGCSRRPARRRLQDPGGCQTSCDETCESLCDDAGCGRCRLRRARSDSAGTRAVAHSLFMRPFFLARVARGRWRRLRRERVRRSRVRRRDVRRRRV